MKHGQFETLVSRETRALSFKLPVLPSREVISAKQIHEVTKLLLWDTQVLPSMVSQPVTVPANTLLSPDHVVGTVVEEEVHQSSFRISLSAQEHKIAVFPALTGSEPDLPACKRSKSVKHLKVCWTPCLHDGIH